MTIITTHTQLDNLCQEIENDGRLAIDLEFIPELTYKPQLCLVQVATNNAAYIVDPLALANLSALWELVADPEILVVAHAGDQDMNLIWRYSGLVPKNIFDIQLAAGFAGLGYPIGYGKLVGQMTGQFLAKTESYTDWLARPLSKAQIQYALEDVAHVLPIYDKLCQQLQQMNRLSWVQEECEYFSRVDSYQKDQTLQFTRVKGASSLSRRGLGVLRSLWNWRDNEASKINKPSRYILGDNIMLELSKHPPKSIADIQRIRTVRPDHIKHHGQNILDATHEAMSLPESELPIIPSYKASTKEETLQADVLALVLKLLCQNANIAPELVATRDEIQTLVRAWSENKVEKKDLPILSGWRRELAGQKLYEILQGATINLSVSKQDEPVQLQIS